MQRAMVRHSLVTLLACLTLLTASCTVLEPGSSDHPLVGSWEWLESTGGFAGWTLTPDSPGESPRWLVYRRDGTVSLYRSGSPVRTAYYTVRQKGEDMLLSYQTPDERFWPQQVARFAGSDTLVLLDTCADCYNSTYRRME